MINKYNKNNKIIALIILTNEDEFGFDLEQTKQQEHTEGKQCSCNFYYLPVNKVEVRENYISEVYEPMFMQMIICRVSVFFKGKGKLQRACT